MTSKLAEMGKVIEQNKIEDARNLLAQILDSDINDDSEDQTEVLHALGLLKVFESHKRCLELAKRILEVEAATEGEDASADALLQAGLSLPHTGLWRSQGIGIE